MTWKIDPSYTWHRCDAQGPLCSTDEKLVGDVAELPGGACLVCVKCVNEMADDHAVALAAAAYVEDIDNRDNYGALVDAVHGWMR